MDFAGENEHNEIETFHEFETRLRDLGLSHPSQVKLAGWVFQAVDFTRASVEDFRQYDVSDAYFWGCDFPEGIRANDLRERGAHVLEQEPRLPFKMFRSFMYTQKEMQECDQVVYKWYKQRNLSSAGALKLRMAMLAHDFSIHDALYDYLEGKSVVTVMGGHAMKRASPEYAQVVRLAWLLAREGFVVATGGGPGAMEAANLGAFLADKSPERVERALELISSPSPHAHEHEHEFNDYYAPRLVVSEIGQPSQMPSLGVCTWYYGHEPPNRFASFHAKMFDNAVREDDLIAIANCGIIYTPGSAGTRQEIFQDACRNHYAGEDKARPMMFLNEDFWKESGVFELVKKSAGDLPYSKLLLCTDQESKIVEHVCAYRSSRGLPKLNLACLDDKWWIRGAKPPCTRQEQENIIEQAAASSSSTAAVPTLHPPS
eukprot:TRINITY_DN6579_c0_g1_i1.p1 TRINITY_DN6579_c0_g1~~TRINITY_DN6579_c0_g1_i1.p1  ORF type:complete len:430 (+),score=89.80 TRINITY_DN6579_c0_g1_i1:75-1364(+)